MRIHGKSEKEFVAGSDKEHRFVGRFPGFAPFLFDNCRLEVKAVGSGSSQGRSIQIF
jgi:hypothetical protein